MFYIHFNFLVFLASLILLCSVLTDFCMHALHPPIARVIYKPQYRLALSEGAEHRQDT